MKPQWICRRNTRYFSNPIRYLKSERELVHSDSSEKQRVYQGPNVQKMRRHLYEENNNNKKKSTFEEQTSIIIKYINIILRKMEAYALNI